MVWGGIKDKLGGAWDAISGKTDYRVAGEKLDRKRIDQSRGMQMGYAEQLGAAARGEGPSAAQDQLQRGVEASMAEQNAMAQSAPFGGSIALAQRNAALGAQQANAAAARDAAMLRAQEQQQAMGQYAQYLQGLRQADIAEAQANQGATMQARLANAGIEQQNAQGLINAFMGMAQGGAAISSMGASSAAPAAAGGVSTVRAKAGVTAAPYAPGDTMATIAANRSRGELDAGTLATMRQAAMGLPTREDELLAGNPYSEQLDAMARMREAEAVAADRAVSRGELDAGTEAQLGTMVSGIDTKTGVTPAAGTPGDFLTALRGLRNDDTGPDFAAAGQAGEARLDASGVPEAAAETFGNVTPVAYEYKPQAQAQLGLPPGPRTGVIAEELEQAGPMGRAMVTEGPDGVKRIDNGQAVGALLAHAAAQEKRLRELEGADRDDPLMQSAVRARARAERMGGGL